MSLHFVETSEEESCLVIARFIGDVVDGEKNRTALANTPGSLFFKECEEAFAKGDFLTILNRFVEQADVLFTKISDKGDLDCCLDILVHVAQRLRDSDDVSSEELASAAKRVSDALTKETDKHAERRLSALTDLFNAFHGEAKIQLQVLLVIIAYAKSSSMAGLLAAALKTHLDTWSKDWQLSIPEKRTLYLAAADVLRLSKKKKAGPVDGYRLVLKALATYQGAKAAELKSVRTKAAGAVVDFIRFPDQYQFDLLEADAVVQLRDDPEFSTLYQLLSILLRSNNIKEFDGFMEKHPEVLDTVKVPVEDIRAKARILVLLSIASQENELSFAAIKEALALENGEVEAWVIRASGCKLLEARIDQLRGRVAVTRIPQRTFTADQWRQLTAQLGAWKENVWTMKDVISSQTDTGLSRGLPAPKAVHAGV
ncbi:g8554 [Coccomyxa viridis]|uniref:G8554 protein n=1 Tax=Coccomyxa viridis TaxID=1274662 RepID=A0ABP1G308_9CHLO